MQEALESLPTLGRVSVADEEAGEGGRWRITFITDLGPRKSFDINCARCHDEDNAEHGNPYTWADAWTEKVATPVVGVAMGEQTFGFHDNARLAKEVRLLFLACPPAQVKPVAGQLRRAGVLRRGLVLVSLAVATSPSHPTDMNI